MPKKHLDLVSSSTETIAKPRAIGQEITDISEDIRNSVCRIRRYGKTFDWMQPYNQNLSTPPSTGTGFILKEIQKDDDYVYILTAYHVVEYSERILVQIELFSAEPILCDLHSYNHSLDVAIIKVPKKEGVSIPMINGGDSDAIEPNDQVQAVGFALGSDRCQFTTGYVSGRTSENIQIDAAINGGNSGGPLLQLKSGNVIGVVVSGYNPSDAQNINYACPIHEAIRSLFGSRSGLSALNAHLNASFDAASMGLIKKYGCEPGCFAKHVIEGSPLYNIGMRSGDILHEIFSYKVDVQARIKPKWWRADALDLKSVVSRVDLEDDVKVEFFSVEQNKKIAKSCKLVENMNVFRPIDFEREKVEYSTKGGVVVQSLNVNILKSDKNFRLWFSFLMKNPVRKLKSVLVVTYVQSVSPFTTMETISVGDVITHVNDIHVENLKEYERAWDQSLEKSDLITLKMYDTSIACATTEELKKLK